MSNSILVLGESGSGKTTSIRNLDPKKCLLIQPIKKKLPFKSDDWGPLRRNESGEMVGSVFNTDDPDNIRKAIENAQNLGKEIIIIDDFQYIMVNEFMMNSEVKGYDKFTNIGRHVWDIIMAAVNASENLRIYFLSHIETNDYGKQKMKTIGKLLDDKVVIEGMFTIVLKCFNENGRYMFQTQNNGSDTTKSPMGMFSEQFIENDLALVDKIYKEYYNIQ